MMEEGVLKVVSHLEPGYYCRLFLVQKVTGGWRPVILSGLNHHVTLTPFRIERERLCVCLLS